MNEPAQALYEFSGFRVDPVRRVLLEPAGRPVPLGPKVFDTLLYLVEHAGELLDKWTLLEAIWPNVVVEDNNLNQAISTLRRVFGEHPGEHRFIVTEPGRGYRFVARVRTQSHDGTADDCKAGAATTDEGRASDISPRRRVRGTYVAVAVAGVLVMAAALVWNLDGRQDAPILPNSVAVLPFEDLSSDPDNAYLAAGMHAEIINQLTKLSDLTVITRDAVLAFSEAKLPYADTAAALKVQSLLTGSFRYLDDEIHVNVQLVDPRTGVILWAQDYRRAFEDVFAVQADIATNMADALDVELSPLERQRVAARPTASMEAYRTYWRSFDVTGTMNRLQRVELLERVVDLDPEFARAYAQLAHHYARSFIDMINDPAVSIEAGELKRGVEANARRALELDPDLAMPHIALGELNMYLWRWSDAESDFAAAYERSPNDPTVLSFYSEFETFRGEYARALAMAERVLEVDPPARHDQSLGSNPLYYVWLPRVYSGAVEPALAALNDNLSLSPREIPARLNLGFVEARRGNRERAAEAFRMVEQWTASADAPSPTATANLAYAYSRIGHTEDTRRLFEQLQSVEGGQRVGDGAWAIAHLAIGAHDQALQRLDRAIERIERQEPVPGWFSLMIIKHNVTGDPVLEEPRYRARRERIRGD